MNRSLTRHLLSFAVALMGLVDLVSALLSRPPERLLALKHLVPSAVLDTSRTFTLLAGVLLLLAANGLRLGKRRAFVGALFLCAVSVPVNLLKAFDFEEASVATALMFLLGVSGGAFAVKSRALSWRAVRPGVVAVIVGVLAYAVVGSWIVERLYAPGGATLVRAFSEALYQLTGLGQSGLEVSRAHHVVRWFLGSISVVGVTLLGGLALALLRPATHSRRHRADLDRVRELIRDHGDSSVASYALAADVDHFFSDNRRAVIAYRYQSDALLVIGDPVGPGDEIPSLLEAFEVFCREHDWRFGFYQARPEYLPWYEQRGWRSVHIGEDPVLFVDRFTLEGSAMGEVRRSVHKLTEQGLEVRLFRPRENPFSRATDREALLDGLRGTSNEWLSDKPGAEMGFCMGRFDAAMLDSVLLAIAIDTARGKVEAFCTWTAIPARHGWALDLMRRRREAPSGVMELIVARTVEHARAHGEAMLSLSLSALVRVDSREGPTSASTSNEESARAFLLERLSRFYDFQGLFHWKRKFAPLLEHRYLVYPSPLALPALALALARVQSPVGLLSYLMPGTRSVLPSRDQTG
ncbi:MAG: phosphatidylglycerol lysyltransferase domain-containing protein [Candidatus Eisenbacteria bacterium]